MRAAINHRAVWVVGILILLSFTGGVVFAGGKLPELMANQSDSSWVSKNGFAPIETIQQQETSQAEFLRMLMVIYKPKQQGVIVPKGAENHWAAPHYATAKSEGLIDCSCIIKPDQEISYQDSTKFVMKAINKKAGKEVVKLEEVQAWVKRSGEVTSPMTYAEVVALLRKMDELVKENQKEEGEFGDDEKARK